MFEFADEKVYTETGVFGSLVGVLSLRVIDGALVGAEIKQHTLDKTVPDGVRAKQFFERYQAETKRLFLQSLSGMPAYEREASPFVGNEGCRSCHAESFAAWDASAHAHAWASLKRVDTHFDSECIACHVVGWNEPNGFRSEKDTPHLLNVGCEACHGPGKAHAKQPAANPIARGDLQLCYKCHTDERAPAFKSEIGWKKIKH